VASSGRDGDSRVGRMGTSLLVSTTLIAVLGFTPWIFAIDAPWAQLAFRFVGLTSLGIVSLSQLRGVLVGSRPAVRAAEGAILLAGVSAVSAVISVHRGKSLEAMLNLLAITGLFLLAALALRGARSIRAVAMAEVLAAIPVAVLGILQHFRPELLPAGNSYPGRALGPFGQPNRLGGYLIAAIPLSLALSFAVHDRVLRSFLLAAAFGLTFCLVATYSRGAWIGLGGGLLALGVVLLGRPELQARPALVAAAAACLVLPALLFLPSIVSRVAPKPSDAPAWNLPIDPEREGSGAMRLAVWGGALAAAKARPAFGWGIGAFREAYDRSKSDTLKRLEAEGGRTADQAHSFYLETLAERGVLGLAALLLFAGLAGAAGFTALGSTLPVEARLVAAGLIAATAALLTHAALEDNLSFPAHGTLLAVNLGLLGAMAPGAKGTPKRGGRWLGALGVAVALGGLAASAASAAAATSAREGARAAAAGRFEQARARYVAATALAPWDDRYAISRGEAAEAAARGGRGVAALREAEASYRSAIAINPSDPVTRHQLARLVLANPAAFEPGGNAVAIHELEAALAQNPYYAEIRNDLGVAKLAAGDRAGAELQFARAAQDAKPSFVDPILNLAALAMQDGHDGEARRQVDLALTRNPSSTRAAEMSAALAARGVK
jgi:putative inorganic carbon (HCO3(-)) transporter